MFTLLLFVLPAALTGVQKPPNDWITALTCQYLPHCYGSLRALSFGVATSNGIAYVLICTRGVHRHKYVSWWTAGG